MSLHELTALVATILPMDDEEREHREDVLSWLASTDDVFRRVKPRTPAKHLVSYFVLRDPDDISVLLWDHRASGLWLPTGGHVGPGEHPVQTVRREAAEELGIDATFARAGTPIPMFVTLTDTTGAAESQHTDVSLWFLLTGSRRQVLHPDWAEFAAVRWWTRHEIAASDPRGFDPHLARFLAKVAG